MHYSSEQFWHMTIGSGKHQGQKELQCSFKIWSIPTNHRHFYIRLYCWYWTSLSDFTHFSEKKILFYSGHQHKLFSSGTSEAGYVYTISWVICVLSILIYWFPKIMSVNRSFYSRVVLWTTLRRVSCNSLGWWIQRRSLSMHKITGLGCTRGCYYSGVCPRAGHHVRTSWFPATAWRDHNRVRLGCSIVVRGGSGWVSSGEIMVCTTGLAATGLALLSP